MKSLVKFLAATIFLTAVAIETLKRYNHSDCSAPTTKAQSSSPSHVEPDFELTRPPRTYGKFW